MYIRRCKLEYGKTYVLHSTNEFGTMYKVVGFYGRDDYSDYNAVLQNVSSGWTFTAHGTNLYEDGSIDWDFSTNGRFEMNNIMILDQEKHDGIFDFYRGRINSAPSYGFTSGHELLMVILRTAFNDSMLTPSEFDTIINLCRKAHIKMMEDNYNAEW